MWCGKTLHGMLLEIMIPPVVPSVLADAASSCPSPGWMQWLDPQHHAVLFCSAVSQEREALRTEECHRQLETKVKAQVVLQG